MQNLDLKIEMWKKRLLDIDKGNKLINFRETKKSNLSITSPDISNLYNSLIIEEKSLSMSHPLKTIIDENGEEVSVSIVKGDIVTNKILNEQQKILKSLRAKAKISIEEQGINTLYLTFGMLKWNDLSNDDKISSPIILVPVDLTQVSINEPYFISLHNDEIILNPSLSYKFENDYSIKLPQFDEREDNIKEYLQKINKITHKYSKNDWQVTEEVHLSLLSFLKINMYEDLDKNKNKIIAHPIIRALSGDFSQIKKVPKEFNFYDHDKNERPIDTFQVVDADSSQQDAILLSKEGISFVLQGPPGTGKSQTITNIIAESLAAGKKVLFVSEKMAALEVVKKRLIEAKLNDFCLTLHSQRANKKEVLNELKNIIKLPKEEVKEELLYKLSELEEKRSILNEYQEELHTKIAPLNASIYEINGKLAILSDNLDVMFSINDIENINNDKLNKYKFIINEYTKTVERMSSSLNDNPWYLCNITSLTLDLRNNIELNLTRLLQSFESYTDIYQEIVTETGAKFDYTINNCETILKILNLISNSPKIPESWLKENVDEHIKICNDYLNICSEYFILKNDLNHRYGKDVFKISGDKMLSFIENEMNNLKIHINNEKYKSNKEILSDAEFIISECEEINEQFNDILNLSNIICSEIGIERIKNINELHNLDELVSYIIENPKPTEKWFNETQLNDVMKILNDANDRQIKLTNIITKVTKNYREQILHENFDDLLNRLNNDFGNILNLIAKHNNINEVENVDRKNIYSFLNNQIIKLNNKKTIIENAYNSCLKITQLFEMPEIKSFEELISLGNLLSLINEGPKSTAAWFDSYKDSIIDKLILDIKFKINQNEGLTLAILSKYNKDIFEIDQKSILTRFNLEYIGFKKHIKTSYKTDKKIILTCSKEQNLKITDEEIIALLNDISVIKENEQWLNDQNQLIKESLGELYKGQFSNWELIEKSREDFKNIKKYFINYQIPQALKLILLENNFTTIKDDYINLNVDLLKDAFMLINEIKNFENTEVSEILNEINDVFSNAYQLKKDYDLIFSYRNKIDSKDIENEKVSDLLNLLNEINEISDLKKWFKDTNYLLGHYLGESYIGEKTNFEKINKSIETVNKIKKLFNDYIPEKLKQVLISGKINNDELDLFIRNINKFKKSNILERINLILNKNVLKNSLIFEIQNSLNHILNSLNKALCKYKEFSNLCSSELPFETIMNDIESLNEFQKTEQLFINNEKLLKEKFDFYYEGIDSSWNEIIIALEFAKKFKEYCELYTFNDKFINDVLNDSFVKEKAKSYFKELNTSKQLIEADFKWFANLFENCDLLYNSNINNIYDKIENCLNLAFLEEYIDYKRVKQECSIYGLEQFIEQAENLKLSGENILNSFLKRFYRLWLDKELIKFPKIYNFRGSNHQLVVDEFINLDKLQLEIAKLRIREILISKIPDTDVATSSEDEIGILKRELGKQKKSMSLRRLFNSIPNLLTTLKPCLMMSPLSVSLYLDADLYEFDVVIFDESSQVCTEDAIGTIIRGKQVIIAGDRYQLPPTSFFSSSLSEIGLNNEDENYQEDEDYYDDIDSYDSILDEASNSILERTLKWHYRSRNENLISFSNERIYKKELTTFPSNKNSSVDFGVEYIFVEDGIYDRGGKKNNAGEAKRVSDIVFEHFDRYPDRTLGVVTFSFAQQMAVESAIRQKRLANPSYEHFFYEDKEEPFFVKNLENVQGDERDTIIISIGYAKDNNGIMYMNFGPLSYSGGYRRLNVAITRAKFNVKLVGSIKPEDINLEKTNAEGVIMLRQYIEYAINGQSLLYNKINDDTAVFKSTFEEAVYNFLIKNGYSLSTQIGCSEYRIDLAVKHPEINGVFVLGIECDGYTYHNAKTVRERDRLRQSVLNDIGWKTYRIWSTEWIKNYKTESEKLLAAVENAVKNYKTNK